MNDDDSAGRARHSALRLLARREHSQYELRRKLKARGYGEGLVDELLTELVTERLLSDTRYAEAMVTHRASRGYGPLRICMELRDRGVAERIVDKALQEAEIAWDVVLSVPWKILDEAQVLREARGIAALCRR